MTEQRRNHPRLPVTGTTFIELLSARAGENESAKMITCNTVDVSRNGLQVILSEELTVGAILQIGVDLPNAPGTLYLAGEVRWCLPSNDALHPWLAGFQILNAEDTDIKTWAAMIAIMGG